MDEEFGCPRCGKVECICAEREYQRRQRLQRDQQLWQKSEELGIPGNYRLADYILKLENRIEALSRYTDGLEKRIEEIQDRIDWSK